MLGAGGRARAVLLPALAAVLLHGMVVAVYVGKHGRDPGSLVCVGPRRFGRPPFEAVRQPVGRGYDGQYYYAIARAPWRLHRHDIDTPARHLRILYPALCWLASGGQGRLLLWAMPAVNLAAIGGIAGIGAWLALRRGMSGWWGFLLPLALDAGLPALRDLTDPVATCAACGLLAAWLGGAPGWSMFVWAAAALAGREQNASVVLILFAMALWRGRLGGALGAGSALGLWSVWIAALRLAYGTWPFLKGGVQFAAPLTGLRYAVSQVAPPTSSRLWIAFHALAVGHLLLQMGLGAYVLARARDRALSLVALAGIALALLGGFPIYDDFWSYGRVLVLLPLVLALWGIDERRRWVLLVLLPAGLGTYAALRCGII